MKYKGYELVLIVDEVNNSLTGRIKGIQSYTIPSLDIPKMIQGFHDKVDLHIGRQIKIEYIDGDPQNKDIVFNINTYIENHSEELRKAKSGQRAEILAAFIAKYNIEPNECVQITRRDGLDTHWMIEKRANLDIIGRSDERETCEKRIDPEEVARTLYREVWPGEDWNQDDNLKEKYMKISRRVIACIRKIDPSIISDDINHGKRHYFCKEVIALKMAGPAWESMSVKDRDACLKTSSDIISYIEEVIYG